jgi:hypothetical protein
MIYRLGLAALTIATLVACGGKDLCQRQAKDAQDCNYSYSDAAVDACQVALDSCTKDEKKALDKFFSCAKAAGTFDCDSEGSDTAADTMPTNDGVGDGADCGEEIADVTEACLVVFTGEATLAPTTVTETDSSSE